MFLLFQVACFVFLGGSRFLLSCFIELLRTLGGSMENGRAFGVLNLALSFAWNTATKF